MGVARSKVWTDAHEQYSSGVDKEMDLYNNEVANGSMVRIAEDKLVRTNGDL
nr:hypothetical protein [Bacillus thuringiensis]